MKISYLAQLTLLDRTVGAWNDEIMKFYEAASLLYSWHA